MPDRMNSSDAALGLLLRRVVPALVLPARVDSGAYPPYTLIRPPRRRHTTLTNNELNNDGE